MIGALALALGALLWLAWELSALAETKEVSHDRQ